MKRPSGSNLIRVKSHNRHAILIALLAAPYSRVELAEQIGVTPMTVTNLVGELLKEGWIIEGNEQSVQGGRGRPRTLLHLDPSAGYTIGVHVGIGTVRIGVVDLVGTLVECVSDQFDGAAAPVDVMKQIVGMMRPLTKKRNVLGIGVGASGLVDVERGVNVHAPSLGWRDVAVADVMGELSGLPVVVENNVRAMALGEAYFGDGRDVESLAFIFGRVGIGAGFVINGEIMQGMHGGAGEIGHTVIIPADGALCRCGQRGCLETLVTQSILVDALGLANGTVVEQVTQFEQILQRGRNGERLILDMIEQVSFYLGIALTNLVNTLNPERIVLGGMYAQGADLFLPLVRPHVAKSAFGRLGEDVEITAATHGLDAGVIGAGGVALMTLFYMKGVFDG